MKSDNTKKAKQLDSYPQGVDGASLEDQTITKLGKARNEINTLRHNFFSIASARRAISPPSRSRVILALSFSLIEAHSSRKQSVP